MKKQFILIFFAVSGFLTTQAQNWTWMKGSNGVGAAGVYGTQGVAAPGNTPPACYEPVEWKDAQGNFWIFGGYTGGVQYANLWKYDPLTNNWTWVKGPGNVANTAGVYGTQGVPAPANNPGARSWGAASWTDNNGNLYMFGGRGYDGTGAYTLLGDFWRYNIATNQWTWISGPTVGNGAGNNGVLGVSAPTNNPAPRQEISATWTDAAGDLWMFGGYTNLVAGSVWDQVWRFRPSTNQWTWMAGTPAPGTLPTYGTIGVPAATNNPGGRWVYARWKDTAGNFWIFGGQRNGGLMNDMWRFNPTTLQWTWMHGPNVTANPGNYTAPLCTYAPANVPGAIFENRAAWTDDCGRFWLFGGYTSGSTRGDFWCFDPTLLQWARIGGTAATAAPGNYGTVLVPAATNYPPARGGAVAWTRPGELWLFGGSFGYVASMKNDMCRYVISPTCPPGGTGTSTAAFNSVPSSGCAPLTVNFNNTSVNGSSYSWNFGDPGSGAANTSTLTNPSHTFNNPGNYTVTLIILPNGCVTGDTITSTVSVSAAFPVNLGPDTAICQGSTIVLDAGNPGYSYLWSTSAITQTISPTTSGQYWVQVTGPGGCIVRDTMNLTVSPYPVVNLGPDLTLCGVASYLLDAGNPGSTYLWSTSAITQTISPGTTGQYWVEVTNPTGCATRDTVNLSFFPNPIVNLGPDTLICAGSTLTMDAGNPGGLYLWNVGPGPQTYTTGTGGLYWVEVTNLGGCTGRDSLNLTVAANPVVNLGPDTTLCGGSSYVLDAGNAGSSFLWSTTEITQTITVTTTGTYTVTVTNASGCSTSDAATVTFSVNPAPNLGPDVGICSGNSTTLDAGLPGMNYLWNTNAVSQTISVNLPGQYWVQVTNAQGCSGRDTINVVVNPTPIVNLGPDQTICAGASVTLDAGNPGSSYSWSTSANTQTISVSTSGTYAVTVTNGFGCVSSDAMNLTIFPLPVVNLGPDADLCEGEFLVLDAGNPGASYNWSNAATSQTVIVNVTGWYGVIVTAGPGCTGADTFNLTMHPNPIVALGPDEVLCEGETLVLDAGTPGSTYLWNDNSTNQTFTVTGPGNYAVTVTTPQGCDEDDAITVGMIYDFVTYLGADTTLCDEPSLTLDAGLSGLDYLWSTNEITEQIVVTESGSYSVIVSNECFTHNDEILVTFLANGAGPFVPNAFTPNGDGMNEIFRAEGIIEGDIYQLRIFDRWGMQIFASSNPQEGWDGTFKGQQVPEGVYPFLLQVIGCTGEPKIVNGAVTLVR